MALSKTQLEYAAARINAVFAPKFKAALDALPVPGPMPTWTEDEMRTLVSNGSARLMRSQLESRYCSSNKVTDFVKFPDHPAFAAWEAKQQAYGAAVTELTNKHNAERDALLDKLYLSSEKDALALIQALG